MSEATLKTKWRRHAAKHGIYSKSMSPHQIPGCPDIVAIDCGASGIVLALARTRLHWIEAKVVDPGPAAFRIDRDPTAAQVLWIRTMGLLGGSAWWLLLSDKTWLLVPWATDEVTRERFRRKARKYGAAPSELFEPEAERKKFVEEAAMRIEELRLWVARAFQQKKRKQR